MDYLVIVEHSCVAEGQPSREGFIYTHTTANSDADAWDAVKAKYAKAGDTVSMGRLTHKCVPATHKDVSISKPTTR